MKSILDFFDYREYLKYHYEYSKQKHSYFSYRYISSRAGLDASFYVKVLQKQLHISYKTIPKLTSFLKLNKRETDYFSLLVRFNKSSQEDEIKHYFEKLISLREPITNTLDSEKYKFFNKWYYIAFRELLNFFPFTGDFKTLASQLNPPVTVPEAKKALRLLEKLELIKRENKGGYTLSEQFVSTGDAWRSVAITNFQRELFTMGLESLDRVPKGDRDLSTLTVSTSWECFEAMQEKIKQLRKDLMQMASSDDNPQAVFQINFQMFPLTRGRSRGKKA